MFSVTKLSPAEQPGESAIFSRQPLTGKNTTAASVAGMAAGL